MKKLKGLSLALSLVLTFSLAACAAPASGGTTKSGAPQTAVAPASVPSASPAAPVELVVFAAASMTETLGQVAEQYKAVAPNITLTFNFDSSGTLKTQIQEGADCDLFLSAAQKQMNQLDSTADAGVNSDALDFVLQGTRVNLLQNKVVLVVPAGNPAGVTSFDDIATEKVKLIALGNSDVPVGQYSAEIFASMGVWDKLNRDQKITFGTNVKEVTSQVSEAAVDCGVIYATDAASAGLTVVVEAPADTHKAVIYPAAVLNITKHEAEAQAFLDYLQSDACTEIFEAVGFSIPA